MKKAKEPPECAYFSGLTYPYHVNIIFAHLHCVRGLVMQISSGWPGVHILFCQHLVTYANLQLLIPDTES